MTPKEFEHFKEAAARIQRENGTPEKSLTFLKKAGLVEENYMLPEYYSDSQFLEVYDLLLQFADVAGEVGCPPSSGDYVEYALRILSVFRESKQEAV